MKTPLKYDYGRLCNIWEKHGVFDYFEKRFKQEIEDTFNWEWIKENMEEVENWDEDKYLGVFIGTVFSLTPSGKYYMPWARSNVTDKEGLIDEIWYDCLNDVLEEKGMWCQSGEGDPCDILFCKNMEE